MRQILEDHPINAQRRAEGKPPANVVLLRGCGSRLALQAREGLYRAPGLLCLLVVSSRRGNLRLLLADRVGRSGCVHQLAAICSVLSMAAA